MTYDTEKVDWRCRILSILPLLLVNPAPSLALIILPSSHYYHNHIANKITIQQIRQKTRVVLHINHISHHRHRPLSLYRPPHRSSPSSATTYTNKGYHLQLISILQRYIIYHIPIQRLQRHVVTIIILTSTIPNSQSNTYHAKPCQLICLQTKRKSQEIGQRTEEEGGFHQEAEET